MMSLLKPVGKKGTDEVFGILRHFHIIWEDERVLVVHYLPVCSDERLGVKGGFTCKDVLYITYPLRMTSAMQRDDTHQPVTHR